MTDRAMENPRPAEADPTSPSPAIQALQENLTAADGDVGSTTKQKKPWFGSLRGVVQRGALQAKAAVDLLRAGPPKIEQASIEPSGTEPRQSSDSAISSQQQEQNKHSSSPKGKRGSPRGTLHNSHVNRHKKRHSVFSVTSRSSSELSRPTSGINRASPQQVDGVEEASKRRSSFAYSLVGSIRGIGRKKDIGTYPSAAAEPSKVSDEVAEIVPLPSSPIDIPSPAPALHLDLGPSGFLLDYPTESTQMTESSKLTDLANIITARPDSHYPVKPPVSPVSTRTTSPAQLLHLRMSPLNDPVIITPGPPTLMPGTIFPLELDSASSEHSDIPAMFERSVTSAAKKECKKLRSMHSIDALAEACAVAHALDELPAPSDDDMKSCQAECGSEKYSTELVPSPPEPLHLAREQLESSSSTLASCPSDMEDLSRQGTIQPEVHRTVESSHRKYHLGTGPPSPVRSVVLPFRPKSTVGAGCIDSDSNVYSPMSPGSEIAISSDSETALSSSSVSPGQSLTLQLELQRSDAWARSGVDQTGLLLQRPTYLPVLEEEDQAVTDDQILRVRDQQFSDSGWAFPNYDDIDSSDKDGLSPRGGPMAPLSSMTVGSSTHLTPGEASSFLAEAETGDDNDFRFHFDSWTKDASMPSKTLQEPDTPCKRTTDDRVDSFSTTGEERTTPPVSPSLSTPFRTPSMGDRLAFDLQRSNRNMRYNALFHGSESQDDGGDDADPTRLTYGYFFDGSVDLDANALQAVDVDNAYASSPTGSATQQGSGKYEAESDGASWTAPNEQPSALLSKVSSDTWCDPFSAPPSTPVMQGIVKAAEEAENINIEDSIPPNPQKYDQSKTKAAPSPRPSTGLTVMDPLGAPGHEDMKPEIARSLLDSPHLTAASRVTSMDTLDSSLDLFVSANEVQKGKDTQKGAEEKTSKAPLPSRYRSLNKRNRITPSIGMPSRHA